jgi:hypothetical protein
MFPYELPPEIMAYAQALDSAPLATEDPTIAVSQTDADTSQDAIPNSTVEGATEEGAVVLEPIAVEVELGDYCGPELPPHLKPENTYLDQRMLSLKSIANDEEHEKIRQTIIDSYGLVREVHVEKSVSELISAYNKKDEVHMYASLSLFTCCKYCFETGIRQAASACCCSEECQQGSVSLSTTPRSTRSDEDSSRAGLVSGY